MACMWQALSILAVALLWCSCGEDKLGPFQFRLELPEGLSPAQISAIYHVSEEFQAAAGCRVWEWTTQEAPTTVTFVSPALLTPHAGMTYIYAAAIRVELAWDLSYAATKAVFAHELGHVFGVREHVESAALMRAEMKLSEIDVKDIGKTLYREIRGLGVPDPCAGR